MVAPAWPRITAPDEASEAPGTLDGSAKGDRIALDEKTTKLASGANFAVLSTMMPDGTAQSHVMWVDTDGENILVNTDPLRQKARNMERDPRVTVTVIDRQDPYRFVEIRGTVVGRIDGDRARDHIDELSRKYHGHDYANPTPNGRVIFVIRPDREMVR